VTKKTEAIRFAGSQLDENRDVRAFFNSDEEAYSILLALISDGFACGDKAVHLIGGILRQIPFSVPPEEFLRERRFGRVEE
jgi:hypothetical protein